MLQRLQTVTSYPEIVKSYRGTGASFSDIDHTALGSLVAKGSDFRAVDLGIETYYPSGASSRWSHTTGHA